MEVRISIKHFTHLMSSRFLKVMKEFTRVWSSGLLCPFVCMYIYMNLLWGPTASISYHLSALQLESINVCRMYIQNYGIRCVSRWKKDELCHMVNRSNTSLVNTVCSWYETGKSYGRTSVCSIYFKTRDVVYDTEKKIVLSYM